VAAGNLLRHDAQARQAGAGESAGTELQPLEVIDGLDFVAEPAAPLRAGVTAGEIDDVVLLEELARELQAIAVAHPRVHLTRVQAKRHRTVKAQRGVFAE